MIKYNSDRAKAWRNAMVAAINAGLDQRLFGLGRDENWWPGYSADSHDWDCGTVYGFTIADIPAIAHVRDCGYDELSIHVALWPTPDARERIMVANIRGRAGDVVAVGWLERRRGKWLQTLPDLRGFFARDARKRIVAALEIEPTGYVDRGPFII
jgi:hypothetical protein